MNRKIRSPLTVERLEDRWLPAATSFSQGVLAIFSQFGEVVGITQTANNRFTVVSAAGTRSFSGVSAINYVGGIGGDIVTVNVNGFTFGGRLTISTNGGNDTVTVNGGGTIQGNVTILTGAGNDAVRLAEAGTALAVRGHVQVADTQGINTLRLAAGGALTVGAAAAPRDLAITGFATISQVAANAITVYRDLIIQNSTLTLASTIALDRGARVDVRRNLSLYTGTGNDSISLGFNSQASALNVDGLLRVNTLSGDDTVTLRGGGGYITLVMDTGSGDDRVTLVAAAANTAWSVNIQLGFSDDSFTLQNGAGTGNIIAGLVNGGPGTNTLTNANPATGDWDDNGVVYLNFV
jgi:hypothetical protein